MAYGSVLLSQGSPADDALDCRVQTLWAALAFEFILSESLILRI